jgi:DNA-binding transcriptional ArsR family regulator
MFGLLLKDPDQTVSAVANHLRLTLPVASQYLRALEARGFLTVRREGRWVYYRPSTAQATGPAQPLIEALWQEFQRTTNPIEQVFNLATAFTHPRRIEVLRVLSTGAKTLVDLRAKTGISRDALGRHLGKLIARGFVAMDAESVSVVKPRDALGRALVRLGCE